MITALLHENWEFCTWRRILHTFSKVCWALGLEATGWHLQSESRISLSSVQHNMALKEMEGWTNLRPIHRPTGKCPLCRFEATGQLLHSAVGSNQVGCSCAWQRSLPCETNIGTTKKIPALNQSWRGHNHPTSNWPYQGHQVPYLVPMTADCLLPLWSNT